MVLNLELSFFVDKADFLKIAGFFAREGNTAVLFSGSDYESATKSLLAAHPFAHIDIHEAYQSYLEGGREKKCLKKKNPWDGLKRLLSFDDRQCSLPRWIGYLAYEMGAYSDYDCLLAHEKLSYPLAHFSQYALLAVCDHTTNKLSIYFDHDGLKCLSKEEKESFSLYKKSNWWASLLKGNDHAPNDNTNYRCIKNFDAPEHYFKKIEKAIEKIRSGDIYQVNVSHNCTYKINKCPWEWFVILADKNPAPFSAFLSLEDLSIISSSPERFLMKRGEYLETRPIKGTIARGKNNNEDLENRMRLLSSEKDKAELMMITDLMRNDLGKISCPGTVKVRKLRACEAYANVFHLLSVIHSRPRADYHCVDMIRACFPGGSITGCPKIKAMEIIHTIEQSYRGIYTGAIGYFSANGDFDFNVAIRTIALKDQIASIHLGGAIVIDSQKESEYAETLTKGETMLNTLYQ